MLVAEHVARELGLHGLRAEPCEPEMVRSLEPPPGLIGLAIRGTVFGDVDAWVREDSAHFAGAEDYPADLVPVVDADLLDAARWRPRLLLLYSTTSRVLLAVAPRKSWESAVRRHASGPRGFRQAIAWPKVHIKNLAWLKYTLL